MLRTWWRTETAVEAALGINRSWRRRLVHLWLELRWGSSGSSESGTGI